MNTWDAFCGRLFDQNAFAIKLGLDNIRRAFVLEGQPQLHAPAIIVGGTNGKGSVASATAAILTAHGLRAGLYTSPHLIEFRERFRIDGVPVSQAQVLAVGEPLLARYADDGSDPQLTFFELGTLMAAQIFARERVDVVVWEVGLGGRLDAVNAIEPVLTVVTSIDLDHQQYLGDTLEAVATEKAGLRRPDVPLVLAWQKHAEARAVLSFPETILVAASPTENLETARTAAAQFLGPAYDAELATSGLNAWRWPGRMDAREVHGRRWLLDAAHNPAGAQRLLDHLERGSLDAVVIGAMADKDLAGMFGAVERLGAPVYAVELPSGRAAGVEQLQAATPRTPFADSGVASRMFDAASKCGGRGVIAVFGSVYLLGEWFEWAGIGVGELVTYRACAESSGA